MVESKEARLGDWLNVCKIRHGRAGHAECGMRCFEEYFVYLLCSYLSLLMAQSVGDELEEVSMGYNSYTSYQLRLLYVLDLKMFGSDGCTSLAPHSLGPPFSKLSLCTIYLTNHPRHTQSKR